MQLSCINGFESKVKMILSILKLKPDNIGALASGLCLIHCLATPLLFLTQACHLNGCHDAPAWWKGIDYFFLIISFFAVYRSVKTTSNKNLAIALWVSWSALCFIILNETFSVIALPEYTIYIAALSLVALHLYNLRYCQCKDESCCVNKISNK